MREPSAGPRSVERSPPVVRRAATSVALALAGYGEVLLVHLWAAPRLPARITIHYSVSGTPNGWASPTDLLVIVGAAIAGVSVVVGSPTVLVERSAALRYHCGSAFRSPLLALQASIVGLTFPMIAGLQLSVGPGTNIPDVALWTVLAAIVPVLVIGVLSVVRSRPAAEPAPSAGRIAPSRPGADGSGGWRFRCSSCGEEFRTPTVSIMTPHLQLGREASLYVRCPRCGERGWDPLLERPA